MIGRFGALQSGRLQPHDLDRLIRVAPTAACGNLIHIHETWGWSGWSGLPGGIRTHWAAPPSHGAPIPIPAPAKPPRSNSNYSPHSSWPSPKPSCSDIFDRSAVDKSNTCVISCGTCDSGKAEHQCLFPSYKHWCSAQFVFFGTIARPERLALNWCNA